MIEIENRDLFKRSIHGVDPSVCPGCNYQIPTGAPGYWRDSHFRLLLSLKDAPITEAQLIGIATSETGRAQRRVFLSHLMVQDQPSESGWLANTNKDYAARRTEMILKINQGKRWTDKSRISHFPWLVVVSRKGAARDEFRAYSQRYTAIGEGLVTLSQVAGKGWDVEIPDEYTTSVQIDMSINHLLADLIKRSSKASGTADRIRRIREIEQLESDMKILGDIKQDMIRKVFPLDTPEPQAGVGQLEGT